MLNRNDWRVPALPKRRKKEMVRILRQLCLSLTYLADWKILFNSVASVTIDMAQKSYALVSRSSCARARLPSTYSTGLATSC